MAGCDGGIFVGDLCDQHHFEKFPPKIRQWRSGHTIASHPRAFNPLVCDCTDPRPEPDEIGECPDCHRGRCEMMGRSAEAAQRNLDSYRAWLIEADFRSKVVA